METTNKPWVKINSETYLECIVGNDSGLKKLAELIQSATVNNGVDVEPHLKSDFKVIVCTDVAFDETESKPASLWQNTLFYVIFLTWIGILPITAIILLVRMCF